MVFKLKKNIISVKRDFESKSVKENYIDLSRNERTINNLPQIQIKTPIISAFLCQHPLR